MGCFFMSIVHCIVASAGAVRTWGLAVNFLLVGWLFPLRATEFMMLFARTHAWHSRRGIAPSPRPLCVNIVCPVGVAAIACDPCLPIEVGAPPLWLL